MAKIMNNQRILWFQDGVKFKAPPERWGDVDLLNKQLISLSGNVGFDHAIVDPMETARKMFGKVNISDFSCVIDLSGFFGTRIRDAFPSVQVITDFHLSRLRVVSSPRLDGSGFLISRGKEDIQKIQTEFDLSKPFFIDDVSWSGRTILEAIKVLGVDPEVTTVGFFAINEGNFGEGRPGAKEVLEDKGVRVEAGTFVNTPIDDGFHLEDFFTLPFLADAFDVIVDIQRIREEYKKGDNDVKQILSENRQLLFPAAFSTDEVKQLDSEGRFVSLGGINKNAFFDTNPTNWLMPSFSKRTNWGILQRNKRDIVAVLEDLQQITREGTIAGEREVAPPMVESSIMRGKERL